MEKRIGRPPKGNRASAVAVKFPADQIAAFDAWARDLGIPVGDLVVLVFAELFAANANSDQEREHFAVPDYITSQIAAHRQHVSQENLLTPSALRAIYQEAAA